LLLIDKRQFPQSFIGQSPCAAQVPQVASVPGYQPDRVRLGLGTMLRRVLSLRAAGAAAPGLVSAAAAHWSPFAEGAYTRNETRNPFRAWDDDALALGHERRAQLALAKILTSQQQATKGAAAKRQPATRAPTSVDSLAE
jgi:hypothetical protein